MNRWTVAGVTIAGAMYLAGIFAATYSLISYVWDRFAAPACDVTRT